ncbi:MAG: hypothetical protein C3F11_09645 [Methylocystaceae bacterium]|nr:MAG: hypothetical protein C3F11_09645 [Methylocystaceae bacterium]
MNEYSVTRDIAEPAVPTTMADWLRQKAPYLIVLALAIVGVAYTSIAHRPLYGYWEFLALAIGVACVVIGWRKTDDRQARIRIALTQALHWGAFLVAMNMLLLPSVNTFLNAPATGLALMLLLALGTFVAGIHVSLEIAVLGVAMAVAVPAIAWFKQSALFLALAALAVAAIGVTFWSRRSGAGREDARA